MSVFIQVAISLVSFLIGLVLVGFYLSRQGVLKPALVALQSQPIRQNDLDVLNQQLSHRDRQLDSKTQKIELLETQLRLQLRLVEEQLRLAELDYNTKKAANDRTRSNPQTDSESDTILPVAKPVDVEIKATSITTTKEQAVDPIEEFPLDTPNNDSNISLAEVNRRLTQIDTLIINLPKKLNEMLRTGVTQREDKIEKLLAMTDAVARLSRLSNHYIAAVTANASNKKEELDIKRKLLKMRIARANMHKARLFIQQCQSHPYSPELSIEFAQLLNPEAN